MKIFHFVLIEERPQSADQNITSLQMILMLNDLHDLKVLKNCRTCYKELPKKKIKVLSSQLSRNNNKEDTQVIIMMLFQQKEKEK